MAMFRYRVYTHALTRIGMRFYSRYIATRPPRPEARRPTGSSVALCAETGTDLVLASTTVGGITAYSTYVQTAVRIYVQTAVRSCRRQYDELR